MRPCSVNICRQGSGGRLRIYLRGSPFVRSEVVGQSLKISAMKPDVLRCLEAKDIDVDRLRCTTSVVKYLANPAKSKPFTDRQKEFDDPVGQYQQLVNSLGTQVFGTDAYTLKMCNEAIHRHLEQQPALAICAAEFYKQQAKEKRAAKKRARQERLAYLKASGQAVDVLKELLSKMQDIVGKGTSGYAEEALPDLMHELSELVQEAIQEWDAQQG